MFNKRTVGIGAALAVVCGLALAGRYAVKWTGPEMLSVNHAPSTFSRRSGDLSLNVCGTAFKHARLRYRLNGGDWVELRQGKPRAPKPDFSLELMPSELAPGENRLEIESAATLRTTVAQEVKFTYDSTVPTLPLTVDWAGELDVQDGHWEVVEVDGQRRVRPSPGTEGYDRLLFVTGAFPLPRRIETEVTFRSFKKRQTWAGFGLLALWGGHLDIPDHRPRRGWLYGIAWYMKPYGPWCELSRKQGAEHREDTFTGLNVPDPEPGDRFQLVVECRTAKGRTRQRMKLWKIGGPEPADWLDCSDAALEGGFPDQDYAVALLAHQCQVEFGPVKVMPLPPGDR